MSLLHPSSFILPPSLFAPANEAEQEWPAAEIMAMWVDNGAGNFGVGFRAESSTVAILTINVD